jgi:hypothetical protein
MKKVLVLVAVCLFVFTLAGIASAGERNGPKCDDPSTYRWDPKTGDCIEKIKEQKCEDPSKFRWDPKSSTCIEK